MHRLELDCYQDRSRGCLRMSVLQTLERWRTTAFLVGSAMFVASVIASVATMVTGDINYMCHLGEGFIAAGWFAGFLGLFGLYRGLADQSRWLVRAAGLFAGIGSVVFAVLGVVSLVVFVGGGTITDFVPGFVLLPGVVVGSLLAFVSFSVACLRSDTHSRTTGLLLLVPSLIFVTNIFILPLFVGRGTDRPPVVGLVVVSALAVAMGAIGWSLRTSDRRASQTPSADTAA